MSYKVIRPFKDLADPEKHDYAVGDIFPRDGYEPTDSFTNGLLTGANTAGSIFLEVLGEDEPKKPATKTKEVKKDPAVEQEETVDETAEEPVAEEEE
jgi:hypothetical protein|nr:MAG TPA: hypothetical protein [Caudoviricetes sp.]